MNSQIEITKNIKILADSIDGKDLDLIKNIRKAIYKIIEFKKLEPEKEMQIRWHRTASEILKDKYVYKKRSCTDLTILFIALALAKNIPCKFVKLYSTKERMLHSVVEINLRNKNFFFDVTTGRIEEEKGLILKEFKIYKKGKDSWDVGLKNYKDGVKLLGVLY